MTPVLNIITMLYNIGDANRPKKISDYIKDGEYILSIPHNIIMFCDEETRPLLPDKSNITYIVKPFNSFTSYKYLENLKNIKYSVSNRNLEKDTNEYYILTYIKVEIIAYAIKHNFINSDKIIYLDFGIGKIYKNEWDIDYNDVHDKISMIMINPYVENQYPREYFKINRGYVGAGLISGNSKNLLILYELFMHELKNIFLEDWAVLEESVFAILIRKYPSLFKLYYGDHLDIITNYKQINKVDFHIIRILNIYLNYKLYNDAVNVLNMFNLDNMLMVKSFIYYHLIIDYYLYGKLSDEAINIIKKYPKESKNILEENMKNLNFYKEKTDIIKIINTFHTMPPPENWKQVTNEYLDNLDVSHLHYNDLDERIFNKSGEQHYRLLTYFSLLYNNSIIFDIGTNSGSSAVALSYNSTNTVYSFDIENKIKNNDIRKIKNISFIIANLWNEPTMMFWKNKLLSSSVIFLDIDPHEGTMEYVFYKFLLANKYKGILICDDVWMFKGMRDNFWSKIDGGKYDLTSVGHFSGTGIIDFSAQKKDEKKEEKNYTLVTAYYNLTQMTDASNSIKARDKKFYFQNAMGTLSLDYNMVVFCEQEDYEDLLNLRPVHLLYKTEWIIKPFEEFPMTKYRSKIIENRIKNPYHFDDRNTASYYLFCMSRYAMLKQVIEKNVFNSTHFCWINICIERMGYKNLIHLDEALNIFRDKFSTCYIDYIPKTLIDNVQEYFKYGRCSMCSGFFTGNKYFMYKICNKIEEKFLEYLQLGYGHADEQLYSPVYFENPDCFEFYLGDYQQMICNYVHIRENNQAPVRNVLKNTLLHKDYALCHQLCELYKKSIIDNNLSEDFLKIENEKNKNFKIIKNA